VFITITKDNYEVLPIVDILNLKDKGNLYIALKCEDLITQQHSVTSQRNRMLWYTEFTNMYSRTNRKNPNSVVCPVQGILHGGNSSHVSKDTKILKFCSFFQPKFLFNFHALISPTQQNSCWSKEIKWDQLKQMVDCEIYHATYHITYLTKYKTNLNMIPLFNLQFSVKYLYSTCLSLCMNIRHTLPQFFTWQINKIFTHYTVCT